MTKQVLLYLPVIHAGYEAFLDRHRDASGILLLGETVIAEFPILAKEIRALAPERAAAYLAASDPALPPVTVVERDDLPAAVNADRLVIPDEDVTRDVAERYGLAARADVTVDRTFLRWDREWSRAGRPVGYHETVHVDEVARRFVARSAELAARSSDWWRQVGAVAVRDGAVVYEAYNCHRPSEYAPYLNGDPRNNFKRGIEIELSTAIHAEAAIVAWAARDGVQLRGADLFVSTFPCPVCARLIAEVGFDRCYFTGPYSMLDGEEILKSAGVQLTWVDVSDAVEPAAG